MAALLSTAAMAQDVGSEPAIVLPPAQTTPPVQTAPVVPAPRIVLPDPVAAQPARPAETTATDAAAPEQAPATVTRTAAVAPRSSASRSASEPAPAALPEPASADTAVAAANVSAPEPAIAETPIAATTTPVVATEPTITADNSTNELAIAGALGALGIVAVGGIALASRRRRRGEVPNEGPALARTQALDTQPDTVAPIATAPIAESPVAVAPAASTRSAAAVAPANSDPVVLPNHIPESYDERDSLLRRLVAARPDRANPFKSPAARARRARLIIQSLGRTFENRKPRFDLSQYTTRWPALRGWTPATA